MVYSEFRGIVDSDTAIRFRCRLQPAGGRGDKVFPPTYKDAKYAVETRTIGGERVTCVHLDSVQSQANRMELALLNAIRRQRISMPLIEVRFPTDDELLRQIGAITHLEAPHRIADAILRDSELDGIRFRESDVGSVLDTASLANATGLFGVSPTSLVFGLWDSTGPLGGLGAKFQRVVASEIVAVDAELGVRTESRIDPLGIKRDIGLLYVDDKTKGTWTTEPELPNGKKRERFNKDGKPSNINHGNIPPSISEANGGVTFDYALQTVVISLPAIRRLHFPLGTGIATDDVDGAARSVLAAISVLAPLLAIAEGLDLRTRTLLVPEKPGTWEVIEPTGKARAMEIDADGAVALYEEAVAEAVRAGLPYRTDPVVLSPSTGLLGLVRRSKEIAAATPAD